MAARCQTSLAVLGCWLAGLGAAGCGADDEQAGAPLPRAAVAELDKQLGSIERRFAFGDGACADIERDNRPAVRRTLARLPKTVDPDVRRALRQSFARLFELARRQCAKHKPPPTSTAPTPTRTAPITTAPAPPSVLAPAATETTPTDTTDTTPTDTTDTRPPTNTTKTTTDTTPTDTTDTTPPTNTTKTTAPPPSPNRTGTQPTTPPTTPNRTDTDSADSGRAR
jgi:hypothetical protein